MRSQKGKQDPHQNGLFKGCKQVHGIEQCTLDNRCDICRPLSQEEFETAILSKRKLNKRKKKNRLALKERQAGVRQSPRTTALLAQQFGLDVNSIQMTRLPAAGNTPAATSSPKAQKGTV